MADKIVVLRSGIIEQVGTPMQLYNEPANIFVAGFIGSPRMNFLDGTVQSADAAAIDIALSAFDGQAVRIDRSRCRSQIAVGQAVRLGVRPQHLHEDPAGPLDVVTSSVEALGNLTYLYADLGSDSVLCIEMRGAGPRIGENVRLAVDPAAAMIFDGDGNRL